MIKHEIGKPWGTVEIAQTAGVTDTYIRILAKRGALQGAYKVGPVWLIPDETARGWLEGRQLRKEEERL